MKHTTPKMLLMLACLLPAIASAGMAQDAADLAESVSPRILFLTSGGYWETSEENSDASAEAAENNTEPQRGYYRLIAIRGADNRSELQLQQIRLTADGPETATSVGIEEMQLLAYFGEEGELIGILGIADFGGECLLRSLAVSPAHQHKGIGTALVTHLLAISAGMNRRIYLFTENAQSFMAGFGFKTIPVDQVPAAIRSSPIIAGHCLLHAEAMVLSVP